MYYNLFLFKYIKIAQSNVLKTREKSVAKKQNKKQFYKT